VDETDTMDVARKLAVVLVSVEDEGMLELTSTAS
tara:strand:- start:264 stop:365 length:102 start_codon:yes stop_codon:yes gene_type:complete